MCVWSLEWISDFDNASETLKKKQDRKIEKDEIYQKALDITIL